MTNEMQKLQRELEKLQFLADDGINIRNENMVVNQIDNNPTMRVMIEANNKKIGAYAMGDNEQPPTDWTKTDTNVLILHVKTDRSVRKKGFVMHWEFVVEDCGCNQNGTRQDGCDKDTRACFCKANVEGNKCDKCKPKHWGFPGIVTNSPLIHYLCV